MADGTVNIGASGIEVANVHNTTSDSIASLVGLLISNMSVNGRLYLFIGSWTNHSYGYTAVCGRGKYSDTANAYFGTIYAHDGNVYTFDARNTNDIAIRKVTVSSA